MVFQMVRRAELVSFVIIVIIVIVMTVNPSSLLFNRHLHMSDPNIFCKVGDDRARIDDALFIFGWELQRREVFPEICQKSNSLCPFFSLDLLVEYQKSNSSFVRLGIHLRFSSI
jgi:hypothetical protein